MLPLIVGRVEMTEKERGFCRLLFAAQKPRYLRKSHSHSVVFNSRERAAGEVIANNPLLLTKHTFPPIELDYDIVRPKRMRCAS